MEDLMKENRVLKRQIRRRDLNVEELNLRIEELEEQKDEAKKALESLAVQLREERHMITELQEENRRLRQVADSTSTAVTNTNTDLFTMWQALNRVTAQLSEIPTT
ncbi:MAG: hypothetical protein LQ338_007851, partial [Usnochroma carphineum]